MKLPDKQKENLTQANYPFSPDVSHGQIPPQAINRIVHETDETRKATDILKEMLKKAGQAPPSGHSYYPIPQKQRARQYEHDTQRDVPGIRGSNTPDLPDRGRDWPEGEDAEGLDRPPQNLVSQEENEKALKKLKQDNDEAKKALAGAPRFSPGPFVSPPEKEYLKLHGYTDDEIETGGATMSPRVRAEFNRWLTSTVRKSITNLKN